MEANDDWIADIEAYRAERDEQRRLSRIFPPLSRPVTVLRWAAAWVFSDMATLGCRLGLDPGESHLYAWLLAAMDWAQGDGPGPNIP